MVHIDCKITIFYKAFSKRILFEGASPKLFPRGVSKKISPPTPLDPLATLMGKKPPYKDIFNDIFILIYFHDKSKDRVTPQMGPTFEHLNIVNLI